VGPGLVNTLLVGSSLPNTALANIFWANIASTNTALATTASGKTASANTSFANVALAHAAVPRRTSAKAFTSFTGEPDPASVDPSTTHLQREPTRFERDAATCHDQPSLPSTWRLGKRAPW
jgi:hypothetical protein